MAALAKDPVLRSRFLWALLVYYYGLYAGMARYPHRVRLS